MSQHRIMCPMWDPCWGEIEGRNLRESLIETDLNFRVRKIMQPQLMHTIYYATGALFSSGLGSESPSSPLTHSVQAILSPLLASLLVYVLMIPRLQAVAQVRPLRADPHS